MATATATANRPLTACCTLSRRTSRSTNTRTAATPAAQMPGASPPRELPTTMAIVGRVASTIPRQPPSCSSTRCRSNSGPDPGSSSAGSPVGSCAAVTGGSPSLSAGRCGAAGDRQPSPGAQLVPGVVDDPLALGVGEAAPRGEGAAGFDAGNPAATEPDEGDRAGAVEQLRLQGGHGLPGCVDHRL